MTYNRTLQGRFINGKGTSLLLLLMSFAFVAGSTFVAFAQGMLPQGAGSAESDWGTVLYFVSLLCYVPAAFITGSLHLFEKRTHWLSALFLWLVALSSFLHGDVMAAFSTTVLSVAAALLLCCQPGGMHERLVYTVFAIIGFSAFLLPQFLYLLPLFLVGLFIANIFSFRKLMAAMLGVATPFWLFYGIEYVFPQTGFLLEGFNEGIGNLTVFSFAEATPLRLAFTAMELLVLLPAAVIFISSPLPAKPLLRRRFTFVIFMDISLFFLSWVCGPCSELFYAWRLPAIAIMASYIFIVKQSRAANIYFIFINLVWLSLAAFGLCLNLL